MNFISAGGGDCSGCECWVGADIFVVMVVVVMVVFAMVAVVMVVVVIFFLKWGGILTPLR